MKNFWIVFVSVLMLAFGLNACSMGEYSDLECDPSDYPAECLTANSYTYCKAGQVISVVCGGNRVCHVEGSMVACKDSVVQEPDNADARETIVPETVNTLVHENVD